MSDKNKKLNKLSGINLVLIFILIAVVAFVAITALPDMMLNSSEPYGDGNAVAFESSSGTSQASESSLPSTTATTIITTEATTVKQEFNKETGRIIVNPEQKLWNLVVVNMTREMPEGYQPELTEICASGKYLHKEVAPYYEAMYEAAKAEGIILTPYSAYRSYERQKNNYNNLTESYMSQYNLSRSDAAAKAATVILPPGTSEHNLGLAIDICCTESEFADTKEYAWLTENAHKYGFILRYTAEKQSVTGIIPEPWHWRYVGVEYAEKIKNSGLCLEEYLEKEGINF